MSKSKRKISPTKTKKKAAAGGNVATAAPKKRIQPTKSRRKTGASSVKLPKEELIFGKQNYIWMGIGFGLIALGMILMSGGSMPSPDVWDESIIYSYRRTVLAPFLMLVGLAVEVYAIFKK